MEEPQTQSNMVWYTNYSAVEGVSTSDSPTHVEISGDIAQQLTQVQIQYGEVNSMDTQQPHIILTNAQGQEISDGIPESSSILKVATKTRSTSNTERVPCIHCGKTFSCNANLRDHLRLHTGERPFSCSECGMAFAQRSNWRLHKRVHTGEKPYMCGICGKTFARSSHLPGHMRVHTGERPYACDSCDQAFTSGQALKNHMRTHTGEKPFICEFCHTPFTHSSSLSSHKKRCTGEKRKRGRPLGTGHRCARKKSQMRPRGRPKKRKSKSKKNSSISNSSTVDKSDVMAYEKMNIVGLVLNEEVSDVSKETTTSILSKFQKNGVSVVTENADMVEVTVAVVNEHSIKMEKCADNEFILGLKKEIHHDDLEKKPVINNDMVQVAASAAGLNETSDLHQEAAVTMATLQQHGSLNLLHNGSLIQVKPSTILYKH